MRRSFRSVGRAARQDLEADARRADRERDPEALASVIALAQGAYYVASGVWPLLHMRSFEAVTGPKVDRWLVKTVGLLVATTGGALLASARGGLGRDVALLGLGSAAALAAVDVTYVAKRRIPPVYLLDAVPEVLIAVAWALAWPARRADRQGPLARLDERAEETPQLALF
jgi:hypothetical protein